MLHIKKLLIITLLIYLGWKIFTDQTVSLGSGVMVKEDPVQINIDSPESFIYKNYVITPLASYDIKAKVLAREDYHFDKGSDLSPMDLALGWKNMSDEAILEKIDISQYLRRYRWSVREFPIPQKEIEHHSVNVHLIPANKYIKNSIKKTRRGQIIRIKGKLVNIDANSGWKWFTSLTRGDTGAGSCEIIWVEDFSIVDT